MTSETKYRERLIKLGLNVAYYRKFNNLTQQELAEKANISRDFLGKIEAPDVISSLSLKSLFKIADALEIPPSKIIEFRDE